ncbi:glycosyltransferase [Pseudarthrobacter sp. 1C304]|uniref:glycosyltransferase n=1 Tax=Pseudarthrobacter sp. 1C304 TaxID=3457438 RepID=UPI003FCFA90D
MLVHEWIEETGGAEKVLDEFSKIFSSSDIFCLWNDHYDRYHPGRVRESWLAKTPLRGRKSLTVPFLPALWRNAPLPDYDWSLVSSHLFAHHVASGRKMRNVPTFVYAHTPARYIWAPDLDHRGANIGVRSVAPAFRLLDRRLSRFPTAIAANSEFVRERVRASWDRDAAVIYPPVDVSRIASVKRWADELTDEEFATLTQMPQSFLLGASRLVPYKRLDAVIKAGEVADLPVVIAGSGPELARLKTLGSNAKVPVIFLGRVSDAMLYALYQRALAFIFPAIEDFGIMPVEAMAAGTPVVATTIGGAAESIVHGVTGALADFDSDEALKSAIDLALSIDSSACTERAFEFDRPSFRQRTLDWIPDEFHEN